MNEIKTDPKFSDYVVLCISLVICSVILISSMRNFAESPKKNESLSKDDLKEWAKCVQSQELDKALLLAKRLCDDSFQNSIPADYLDLLKLFNISSTQITSPFNIHDANRWYDSFVSAKIANELSKKSENFPMALLNYMNEKFKFIRRESALESPLYISHMLNRKELSNNEILRFASEISLQAGFEPLIATLHNEKQEQIHAILQLRKQNIVCIVDFKNNFICENRSVQDILTDAKTTKESTHQIFSTAKFARFHIPSEIQDYKIANSRFYKLLLNAKIPSSDLPVFGLEPVNRLKNAILTGEKEGIPPNLFAYWHYPLFIFSVHEKIKEK